MSRRIFQHRSSSSSRSCNDRKKTTSRRAQRRLVQQLEMKRFEAKLEMGHPKQRVISMKQRSKQNQDNHTDIHIDDPLMDAHDRIETIIKDYSNEIKRINEQLRDAPTISDVHSDNEFGLRKATGAIRYHNKSTLIGKSRRRTPVSKSQMLARLATRFIDDTRTRWLLGRGDRRFCGFSRPNRYHLNADVPPRIFTHYYYVLPAVASFSKTTDESPSNEEKDQINQIINGLQDRQAFGHQMTCFARSYRYSSRHGYSTLRNTYHVRSPSSL
jgi:hypothetical protein